MDMFIYSWLVYYVYMDVSLFCVISTFLLLALSAYTLEYQLHPLFKLPNATSDSSSEFCKCTLSDNPLPMAGVWRESQSQYCFYT